ncbi:MAG: hypothetical protein J5982_03510 [Bacilli bacterium]|nr:hypothetical protein [Bacilli bacterium]
MEAKIIELLIKYNNIYQGFYHLTLQRNGKNYIIVDDFEEFYYGSQDFDNLLEDLTSDLKKLFKNDSLYLECECPGRWGIALM